MGQTWIYVVKQMLKPRPVAIKTAISISATGNHWCWENGEEALSSGFPHVSLQSGLKHACRSCWERRVHTFVPPHMKTHIYWPTFTHSHTLCHRIPWPQDVTEDVAGSQGQFVLGSEKTIKSSASGGGEEEREIASNKLKGGNGIKTETIGVSKISN